MKLEVEENCIAGEIITTRQTVWLHKQSIKLKNKKKNTLLCVCLWKYY